MDTKNNTPNTPGNEAPSRRTLVPRLKGAERLGRSPSMLHEYLRPDSRYYRPDVPQLVKFGRSSFFYEDELDAFIASLPRARDAQPADATDLSADTANQALTKPKGSAADMTKGEAKTRSSKDVNESPSIRPCPATGARRLRSVGVVREPGQSQVAPAKCSSPRAEAKESFPSFPTNGLDIAQSGEREDQRNMERSGCDTGERGVTTFPALPAGQEKGNGG